jgi:glycine cleavage system H protein
VADYPEDLEYTAEHEWVQAKGDTVRVGITDYAQDALGDVVYVSLPEVGAETTAGQPISEIESTKSVSDVYAPVSGVVTACNDALDASPQLINSDPYGEGWIVEIRPNDPSELDSLLDVAAYRATLDQS